MQSSEVVLDVPSVIAATPGIAVGYYKMNKAFTV